MVYKPRLQPWARTAASSAHTSPVSACFSPGWRKWALNRRSFSTSMSRSAKRIGRLRVSSQRRSSTRLADCTGSSCSARSVFNRHPSSSKLTCRLRGTSSRNLSKAAESRALSCCAAGSGSAGNPVRAQKASLLCCHCRSGRKNDSNRPKFFAPSIARLPARISSRTLRNSALSQHRRSIAPSRRMSGSSALGAKSTGASEGSVRRPDVRSSRYIRTALSVGDAPSSCSSRKLIRLRNGAANRLTALCRSTVSSKRALRSPGVQRARSVRSSRSSFSGTTANSRARSSPSPTAGSSSTVARS